MHQHIIQHYYDLAYYVAYLHADKRVLHKDTNTLDLDLEYMGVEVKMESTGNLIHIIITLI